jgi:hypothetical protein
LAEQTKEAKYFRGNREYKVEFEKAADALIQEKLSDRQERIQAIDALCEEYAASIGQPPDSLQLDRLANEILREELTDKRKNKTRVEEYPILSDYQISRRMFGVNQRKGKYPVSEVPLYMAMNYGTDNKEYRSHHREKRTITDLVDADLNSRPLDPVRRKQYEDFIKLGEVRSYYLDEKLDKKIQRIS